MILIAIISLGGIGAIGAVLLYATSKKFEIPKIPGLLGYRRCCLQQTAEAADSRDARDLPKLVSTLIL
jgi:hypothetical protein